MLFIQESLIERFYCSFDKAWKQVLEYLYIWTVAGVSVKGGLYNMPKIQNKLHKIALCYDKFIEKILRFFLKILTLSNARAVLNKTKKVESACQESHDFLLAGAFHLFDLIQDNLG